ncbi:hypothetical protein BCV72DRAFT_237454, partial [Rhizopus microsporus var. microsporus]
LFCVENNPENVARYEEKIAAFGEIDICYEKDPKKPILAPSSQIHKNLSTYHPYPVSSSEKMADLENNKVVIETNKEV